MAEETEAHGASSVGFILAACNYDFEAEDDSEMSLKVGDIVRVIDQNAGDGWWEGVHEDGSQQGLFPGDYVDLILVNDSDDDKETDDDDLTAEDEDDAFLPPPPAAAGNDDTVPGGDSTLRESTISLPPPPMPAPARESELVALDSIDEDALLPPPAAKGDDDLKEAADVDDDDDRDRHQSVASLPPPLSGPLLGMASVLAEMGGGASKSRKPPPPTPPRGVPLSTSMANEPTKTTTTTATTTRKPSLPAPPPPPAAVAAKKRLPTPPPKDVAKASQKTTPYVTTELPAPVKPAKKAPSPPAPRQSKDPSKGVAHDVITSEVTKVLTKQPSSASEPTPPPANHQSVVSTSAAAAAPQDIDMSELAEALGGEQPTSLDRPSPPPAPHQSVKPTAAMQTQDMKPSTQMSPKSARMSALPRQGATLNPQTARKLLAAGQAPCIVSGPKWYSETNPPVVRIVNARRESKLNGVKQFIAYEIEAYSEDGIGEPQSVVSRRYKHFLWLHTTLSDLFPGIVVPPLPVKQFSGRFSDAFVRERQVQLERFLNRLARNPLVRVSHAFTHFLTATTFEDWKHGKNSVRRSVAHAKPSKSSDSPQYFFSLSYPADNIPFDRVLVVDGFTSFTKVLRRNTIALHASSNSIASAYADLGAHYEKLGGALQSFSTGRTVMPERRAPVPSTSSEGRKSPSVKQRQLVETSPAATKSSSPKARHVAKSTFFAEAEPAASPPSSKKAERTESKQKSKFFSEEEETTTTTTTTVMEKGKDKSAPQTKPDGKPVRKLPPPPPPPPHMANKPTLKPRGHGTAPPPPPGAGASDKMADTTSVAGALVNIAGPPMSSPKSPSKLSNGQPATTLEYIPCGEVENWSWRKSCRRFPRLMGRLHGVGSGLVKLGQKLADVDGADAGGSDGGGGGGGGVASLTNMADDLREYIGLLQALPNVVRVHEEAVEQLNAAKASTVQRETLAQANRHADACSNVVLSEMDHFYESLLTDMQGMVSAHLRRKLELHRMMVDSYENMLDMLEGDNSS